MPPKPKFTREEITAAALELVKERGCDALTARELGKRLGASVSPLFTVFKNMDEVRWAARELALQEFKNKTKECSTNEKAFRQLGMLMVDYALCEPELYKLLFMQEHPAGRSFAETMSDFDGLSEQCVELLEKEYELSRPRAKFVFESVWVQAFGLGALCAMKVCDLTHDEIADRLQRVFAGLLLRVSTGAED